MLNKGIIDSKEESYDIGFMLGTNKIAHEDKQKGKILQALLSDFHQRNFEAEKLSTKPKRNHTELVKREEKDGIIKESFISWSGPKPRHFNERQLMAPDGKRKLTIAEFASGNHSSTSVSISFEKATGSPFSTKGIYPDLKAFWKDNNTIVIEIKKSYSPLVQNKKIRSFNDTITIEYIET